MERGVNWKRYQADRRRSAMLGVLIGAAIGATAVILGARVGWWSF